MAPAQSKPLNNSELIQNVINSMFKNNDRKVNLIMKKKDRTN
jgi:hypothetical protein